MSGLLLMSGTIPTVSDRPAGDPDAVATHVLSLHAELSSLRSAIMRGDSHADLLRGVEAASDVLDDLTDAIDAQT